MTPFERDLGSFENLVLACDFQEIEFWRPRVKVDHVAALTALYDRSQSWDERCAVLQLLQDTLHPEVTRRMHHFLAAPEDASGDNYELTKATALCHLQEDFSLFMTYYADRRQLADDVAIWRAERP